MIKEIEIKNFKRNNTVQQLTGKDIFTGSNGSGKSSRIEALLLSILGYIPQKGKTLQEMFKYANSKEMAVGIKTDSFTLERKIGLNKSDKLSQSIKVFPSKGEKTLLEKEKRIKEEVCEVPIVLDFQEFLNMSDSDRRKFIYSLSTGGNNEKWNRKSIKEYIEKYALKKVDPEQQPLLKKYIAESLEQYSSNIEQWLTSMLVFYEEKQKFYRQQAKMLEDTVKKMSELKNDCAETDIDLAKNKSQLEELQKKLIECEKQITLSSERKKQIEKTLEKIKALENEVKAFNMQDKNIKEIEDKISKLKNAADYDTQSVKCKNQIKELKDHLQKLEDEQAKITEAGLAKKAEIEKNQGYIDNIRKQGGKCVLDSKIKCNKDFGKYVAYIQQEITEKKDKKDKLLISYKEIRKKKDEVQNGIEKLTKEYETLINRKMAEEAEINNLTAKLNEQKLCEIKKKELADLKNELAKSDPAAPIEMLIKNKNAISLTISKLKEVIDNQETAKRNMEMSKQVSIEYKNAIDNEICTKVLCETLGIKGLQGQIIKDNLDPIKNVIQRNLSALGIDKEFYFQCENGNGKEIFEFGWISEGKKVEFNALSTGQQVFLLLAFITAIMQKTMPKIKVLVLDNIECLDKKNVVNVINGINIISKIVKVDNVIMSGLIYDPHVLQLAQKAGYKIWDCDVVEKEEKVKTEDEEAI